MEEGDRAISFRAFVHQHEAAVRAFVARRARDGLVDDAVQEAFLVTWERFDHVVDHVDPSLHRAWVSKVAVNVLRHHYRTDGRRGKREDRVVADPTSALAVSRTVAGDPDRLEQRDGVDAMLAGLSDDDRQLVLAAVWDDFTSAELAELVGCSEAAARKRLSRAMARLRSLRDATVGEVGAP